MLGYCNGDGDDNDGNVGVVVVVVGGGVGVTLVVLSVLGFLALGRGLSARVVDLDGIPLGLARIFGGDGGSLLEAFQESTDDFFLVGFHLLEVPCHGDRQFRGRGFRTDLDSVVIDVRHEGQPGELPKIQSDPPWVAARMTGLRTRLLFGGALRGFRIVFSHDCIQYIYCELTDECVDGC